MTVPFRVAASSAPSQFVSAAAAVVSEAAAVVSAAVVSEAAAVVSDAAAVVSGVLLPPQAVGKTVLEVNLRSRFGVNIVAIENNGAVIEMVRPDYAFREKDILYLSGSKEGIMKLAEWAQ